jgi:hypothetical protein
MLKSNLGVWTVVREREGERRKERVGGGWKKEEMKSGGTQLTRTGLKA